MQENTLIIDSVTKHMIGRLHRGGGRHLLQTYRDQLWLYRREPNTFFRSFNGLDQIIGVDLTSVIVLRVIVAVG